MVTMHHPVLLCASVIARELTASGTTIDWGCAERVWMKVCTIVRTNAPTRGFTVQAPVLSLLIAHWTTGIGYLLPFPTIAA